VWWECENCGGVVELLDAPGVCSECGTAGPALAGLGPSPSRRTPYESTRDAWLHAGMHAKKKGVHDAAQAR